MVRIFAVLGALLGIVTTPLHAEAGPGPQDKQPAAETVNLHFCFLPHSPRELPLLPGPDTFANLPFDTIGLRKSVLRADETGSTDYRQTESLDARVHVKKMFVLEAAELADAEVLFYGSANQVTVNGIDVAVERVPSTGWCRVALNAGRLKAGANEIVFAGGGQLLLEPGRPGRSFKSNDGGKTWSNQSLGKSDDQAGEYLIRLRLNRYAPSGWVLTPTQDLWAVGMGDSVSVPARVLRIQGLGDVLAGQPAGTRLKAFLRLGDTPTPDAKRWTNWIAFEDAYAPTKAQERLRFAQFRFELATDKPQATPKLHCKFKLELVVQRDKVAWPVPKDVTRWPANRRVLPSVVPYVWQAPSPRLKLLRERYKLDEVIAPGKTELEQLMLLRYWVRNQWHSAWGNHPSPWMPPWDAHIILENRDQPDCLTMCTHYAAVFTQCCLALGWNARHCILDHHCVAEVFLNEHGTWAVMDAGNSAQRADLGLHYEHDGQPLSAYEMLSYPPSGSLKGVEVCFTPKKLSDQIAKLCRPAPAVKGKAAERPDRIPAVDLPKYPVCQLENFRRYAFPHRNNYLDSLLPGELYQGWSEYFYDGYYWVDAQPDGRSKFTSEYSKQLLERSDVNPDVNRCHLYLARTEKPGELRVDVETLTPNLARFEMATDPKGPWKTVAATSIWSLKTGADNELFVRSVNAWDRSGYVTKVTVECPK
jgi:hypothetical protein